MDKKYIEDIIDTEIIEKYSIDILDSIDGFSDDVRNYDGFEDLGTRFKEKI